MVRSGCNGKVLVDGVEIAEVRSWSFNWVAEVKEYSSSSTNCAKKRIAGVKDVQNGSIEVYVDDEDRFDAQVQAGDTVTLQLYEDADDIWTIEDTVIESIEPSAQIEAGDPVAAKIGFAGGTVTSPANQA